MFEIIIGIVIWLVVVPAIPIGLRLLQCKVAFSLLQRAILFGASIGLMFMLFGIPFGINGHPDVLLAIALFGASFALLIAGTRYLSDRLILAKLRRHIRKREQALFHEQYDDASRHGLLIEAMLKGRRYTRIKEYEDAGLLEFVEQGDPR